MLKKAFLAFYLVVLNSQLAFGFAGVWEAEVIPAQITDVKLYVYNFAETPEGKAECGSSQCFRLDIHLNNVQVATWVVSPGKPHYGTAHVGGYTPIYNGERIHSVYGRDYVSWRRKYSMPYVMYIEDKSFPGKISNYGFHTGYEVNGERLSHGCIRMLWDDARILNSWIREAISNGGEARVWSRGTRP